MRDEEGNMSPDTITIILTIVGTVVTTAVALASLILITTGRLGERLNTVEKETSRLSGLLEGYGLTGRGKVSAA